MFGSIKREHSQQQQRSSRFANNEDRYLRMDPSEISSRLASNFSQMIDLLAERKQLLLKKLQITYEEMQFRVQAISRGKIQDLKQQARLLKDQNLLAFIENPQKLNATKQLFKKVSQQNLPQLQNVEKQKGKKYYDRQRDLETQLSARIKKYEVQHQELIKLNDKQQAFLSKLDDKQSDLVSLLKKKQGDYLRRADLIQQQIDRQKSFLKDNKLAKDKKKKQLQLLLSGIMDVLQTQESIIVERSNQLEDLFGGSADMPEFDRFYRQMQSVIDTKTDLKKQERKKKAFEQLTKIAWNYDIYIEQLQRQRQNQVELIQQVSEGLKVNIRSALLQKIYFQDISSDKGKISEALKKFKAYRQLLEMFQPDKTRISKDASKISQQRNMYLPRLKMIANEQNRRQELRRQIQILSQRCNELERAEKQVKQQRFLNDSYVIARQAIEREMQQCGQRGDLPGYRQRLKDLEKMDRQYQQKRQSILSGEFERIQAKVYSQIQQLYSKYADLINTIIVENEKRTFGQIISKLVERLPLI